MRPLIALTMLAALAGCRQTMPTGPANDQDPRRSRAAPATAQGHRWSALDAQDAPGPPWLDPDQGPGAPRIKQAWASVGRGGLEIQANLAGNLSGFNGRWAGQLLLNTDQNDATGYGRGYEYVARLIEADDTGRFPVRLADYPGEDYPGGWGPITGFGRVTFNGQHLRVTVPASALSDDGQSDLALDVYAWQDDPYWGGGYAMTDYREFSTRGSLAVAP